MKSQQSKAVGSNLANIGLTASVFGLVLCPFAYIAIGALAGFAPAFSFLALPPLLASIGYLIYRFFSKPGCRSANNLHLLAEIVSWMLILGFLIVASNFTLLTKSERIGLFSTLFLITSFVSLPAVLIRKTALGARLMRLQDVIAIPLLSAILLVAIVAMAMYLLRAPAFH